MVWDARDLVGMANEHFPCIYFNALWDFEVFSLLGICVSSVAQSLVCCIALWGDNTDATPDMCDASSFIWPSLASFPLPQKRFSKPREPPPQQLSTTQQISVMIIRVMEWL